MGNTRAILANYTKILETYSFLKKSQWWSAEQLQEYQENKLSNLISHAYENVPYYHTLFTQQGLQPSDITTIADLQKLPVLTKETIRENQNDMKARNYPKKALNPGQQVVQLGPPFDFMLKKEHGLLTTWLSTGFIWIGQVTV